MIWRVEVVAYVSMLALASCSSDDDGKGDGPPPPDYTVLKDGKQADGGADSSGDAVTTADGSLPVITGDLRAIVAAMPFVPEGGGYSPPAKAEVQAFEAGISTLLLGQHESASSLFKKVGLEAVVLSETGGKKLLLVREPAGSLARGWGLYVFDVSPARELVIEVPHTRFEEMTEDQGAEFFLALEAAALMVAGTHRCASTVVSPCDGVTQVCSSTSSWESHTISDVAHYADGPFHAAHRAVTAHLPKAVAIQLHGFAHGAGEPHAIVSDGTTFSAPSTSLSNTLAAALEKELGLDVESCNQKHTATLCGSTNVQGRHSNGSPAPCTVAASAASGRFLHLEQSKEIRGAQRQKVLAALKSVFP
jgi:hypothetical protein